jgi:predicted AAA+ superfamily ATPase
MEQELLHIAEQAKVLPKLLDNRIKDPVKGIVYPQRYIFVLLQKYLRDFFKEGAEPRMIGLAGLRGVGKTTLMWQLARYAYNNITTNIWFFNVNSLMNLGYSIQEVLLKMEDVLGCKLNVYEKPIVFLFDEVHDDPQWAKTLKILYDECRMAFVIATGSSALLINQTPDLAARMKVEKIYPFKFMEFIMSKFVMEYGDKFYPIKGFSTELRQGLFYCESYDHLKNYFRYHFSAQRTNDFLEDICAKLNVKLDDLIKEYVYYHNIPRYSLYKNRSDINSGMNELVKRIVYEDVARVNSSFGGSVYEKLLYRLAASDEVNIDKLSGILSLKKENLQDVINILDQSELINELPPYSNSIDARIIKNKKSFFMSPSIRRALLSNVFGDNIPEMMRSKMWEDIVVMYLVRILDKSFLSYSSQSDGVNPDFVIDTFATDPIIIEVGQNKTSARQIAQHKGTFRYGIIINVTAKEPVFVDNSKTIILPLSWFLIM